jgi:hypothetical protein
MLEYLHVLTFFSWIPLALLARSQKGRKPAAPFLWALCGVTFLLCGYILYLDFIWSKTVIAPIRLDLLFLIPLSTIAFTGVAVWGVRKSEGLAKIASVLLLVFSVPTLLVFAQGIWQSSKDIVRLNARPALIFEAQFRNPQTFRNFFGNIDAKNDPRVGHFRAEDPKSWASRVIVNDQGHFWLMFKCGENVECVYSQANIGEISLPGTFKAQSETGLPQEVVVSAWSPDRFTLNFSPRASYSFVRAPVSYHETVSAPGKVSFHGSFSQVRIDRDYIYLIQIWLWQSGDRWVAYYVRRNARCGSINDFVSASAYDGKLRGAQIYFTSATGDQKIEEFQTTLPTPTTDQIDAHILYNGRPLEDAMLKRRPILYSPIYESAPTSDFDGTTDWLKTVSMGYFMSWKAECAEDYGAGPAVLRHP